ncbi:30S ribosomal protein S10 [Ureaplasma parvum]|uniref:Small ribosomal subunit protein uS10 n=6 Tax=Ureaplasma TaxID=2129 RepID=RS10_UREPA|nr:MULTISPECIES: 30S ribosomal protein S10 [Ureaplasma]B1AIL9.1 RecName: Full=Small ribosomal subunit protein uS10; AltName: Full=30S ribosomal protein S10 [Ureaplasma parvum serovar 3 str. ATCC 27815]Q9PQR1.1 RecName: Full=Small ribosomal subunit protein uS10; AltName: Full=30S ribosomal protein S10 [Ureaplasma parvum serovar 3 str. ATCC 700970]pir/G82914/ ribosomal protein S10 UU230 [imported] - Ureaplasma urealyticum [Ureaplasma urealyticum]EDX53907.1 ribosomal protein S10 [Ureaplasma urealy
MNQELRIRLESYDHRLLDDTVKTIVNISNSTGSKLRGPIPLPTKKEIFTILRSPHVNKSSREQFERRTHKRLIILENPQPKTMEALKRLSVPFGVEVTFKI